MCISVSRTSSSLDSTYFSIGNETDAEVYEFVLATVQMLRKNFEEDITEDEKTDLDRGFSEHYLRPGEIYKSITIQNEAGMYQTNSVLYIHSNLITEVLNTLSSTNRIAARMLASQRIRNSLSQSESFLGGEQNAPPPPAF